MLTIDRLAELAEQVGLRPFAQDAMHVIAYGQIVARAALNEPSPPPPAPGVREALERMADDAQRLGLSYDDAVAAIPAIPTHNVSGASPAGTACSVASLPEPEVSALRVPPAGAEGEQ